MHRRADTILLVKTDQNMTCKSDNICVSGLYGRATTNHRVEGLLQAVIFH